MPDRALVTLDEAGPVLDVTQRLCELVEKVSDAHGNVHATDCFCSRGGNWISQSDETSRIWLDHWRHDPESSIAFIERATQRALNEKKLRDYLISVRHALAAVVRAIRRNPFA